MVEERPAEEATVEEACLAAGSTAPPQVCQDPTSLLTSLGPACRVHHSTDHPWELPVGVLAALVSPVESGGVLVPSDSPAGLDGDPALLDNLAEFPAALVNLESDVDPASLDEDPVILQVSPESDAVLDVVPDNPVWVVVPDSPAWVAVLVVRGVVLETQEISGTRTGISITATGTATGTGVTTITGAGTTRTSSSGSSGILGSLSDSIMAIGALAAAEPTAPTRRSITTAIHTSTPPE